MLMSANELCSVTTLWHCELLLESSSVKGPIIAQLPAPRSAWIVERINSSTVIIIPNHRGIESYEPLHIGLDSQIDLFFFLSLWEAQLCTRTSQLSHSSFMLKSSRWCDGLVKTVVIIYLIPPAPHQRDRDSGKTVRRQMRLQMSLKNRLMDQWGTAVCYVEETCLKVANKLHSS